VRRAAAALLGAGLALAAACNPDDVVHRVGWFATMRVQRSVRPYARPLPPVPGTVPVTGGEAPVTLQTADRLANPRTRTSESLNRGRFLYETYCLVCHGAAGRGDGPISSAAGGPFFGVRSLVNDTIARRSDGYLYAVLVNAPAMGRGLMPIYGDKVRGADRWDVVNYVRMLQAQARAGAAGRAGGAGR
jgi:mono/diheme cytochrome c family protein